MRRNLFHIMTALSLVLCAAVCVLWLRSHRMDLVTIFGQSLLHDGVATERTITLSSRGGVILVDRELRTRRATDVLPPGSVPSPSVREKLRAHWERRHMRPWTFEHQRGLLPGQSRMANRLPRWLPLEFHWWRGSESPGQRFMQVRVPYWPLVAAAAGLPLLWVMKRRGARRRWRIGAGRCPTCGYDLRATPDCCPECGPAVAPCR